MHKKSKKYQNVKNVKFSTFAVEIRQINSFNANKCAQYPNSKKSFCAEPLKLCRMVKYEN
ncbi:hypothetical protein BpHYR1_031723 [Brachionus plicatilis]|uniref:Uncharacterized protein n=1 Tax=Brachionus plicatilis TaxID=10195 RepID=A0A3M7PKA7_BRAPC|nr:hypothetical protein BpHYR1_031723 [Brachionus plicatilis]